jgi:hypothetical protein
VTIDRDREVLAEILDALALPRRARARWLDDLAGFCARHGGVRRYRELLDLIAACRAADRDRAEDR